MGLLDEMADDILWVEVSGRRVWERDPDDKPIPEGSMRVGPGTDAVVWRTCPTHKAQA